jgi:adenylate kinase
VKDQVTVLTAPQSRLSDRREDRERFAEHAAPEAIREHLKDARAAASKAANTVSWLEVLLARRCQQVMNGEWPPKPEAADDRR